jgi:hypothetical protein
MRKSARVLGWDLGMSARDVNSLLMEHGYMEGQPGAYDLTEKGVQFGHEVDHHRGPGGYARYNADWTTRTWDEAVLDSLAVDLANASAAPAPELVVGDEPEANLDDDYEASDDHCCIEADLERDPKRDFDILFWVGVGVVTLIVGAVAAPHAKRLWNERVEPRAKRLWRRVTKSEPVDALHSDAELPAHPLAAR